MRQIVHHPGAEEFCLFERRLVDDDFDTLGFDALHDALYARRAEVVRTRFHDQPVNADDSGVALEYAGGNKVFSCSIGLDDGINQVLRDIAVVGQKLFGVFGQAVTAVAERGVVVVVADAGIEAHPVDNLFGIQAVCGGIGVQFVEVGDAHREIGVGKQLDRLGLGGVGEQHGDILPDRALLEQLGKDFCAARTLSHDDARGVQVVV